jgi:TetR/AcrR family transcriptional regulator, cholesterol catabolism regulator
VVIENHLSFFAANMAEMKVLSHEADSLAGEMHNHVSGRKQQYTRLVRHILTEVQHEQEDDSRQKIDLTVATYALFGMMNWIYNWYDPRGPLAVGELVDNITRLFLSGFMNGRAGAGELHFSTSSTATEQLSVWRATET